MCVCVSVGAITGSCGAVEETGGAGKEGRGAGPPRERDAFAQCFRRCASDTDVQRLITAVTAAKVILLKKITFSHPEAQQLPGPECDMFPSAKTPTDYRRLATHKPLSCCSRQEK